MAGARRVTIEFLGKDKTFGRTADQMGNKADRLGAKMRKVGKMAALGLGASAVIAAKGLYEMGQAAMEDQQAASLLAKQLRNSAGATKGQIAQTENWISAQGKALGVTDDELRPALSKLVRATGDVGEAQKLASLAMDVSAGSGKDLGAVSQALAKAQNGNVAGLARLGIATKNAKGETISFKEATKAMADQFGGSASTKAETLQGKMARLKLTLSEAGESIGYKLLPVAEKLANFLNDEAVPAVSRFAAQMKSGEGAGGQVAGVLDDVTAAGKATTNVVGKLLGIFGGMPGGAQKALLLAGAATLISRKFSLASLSVSDFDRKAALATTKSAALKGGLMAAGVGMASLASNTSNATVKLGASTAAAALMGGAIAGPLGAALGAGGVLLSAYSHRGDAAAASQARMKAAVGTVTATLNEQTGALTKLTRTTVAKTLADTGAFDAATKVGASYKDVLAGALGNEKATKRVDAATRKYVEANSGSIKSLQKSAKVAATLTGAVHGTTSAIEGERRKLGQVDAAMGKLDGKTANIHVKSTGITGLLSGLASIGNSLQRAIDKANKLKVGSNAKGTDNWRGGLTMVGEEGPELINLAKGAQVIPNNEIPNLSGGAGRSGSSGAVASAQQPVMIQLILDSKVVAQSLVKFERDTGRPIGLRLA